MKTLNDYIKESILDDEEELIGRATDAFKNWIAFVSCMYFEKNWDDDKILEHLNSKYVMSFFPSLKGYKWVMFNKSKSMKCVYYTLQNSKEQNAAKLELITNKASLEVDSSLFSKSEFAKIQQRLIKDCKMEYKYTTSTWGPPIANFQPKYQEYWKDWDSFK